jgi:NADH:ubiquinone oxidoreductase subunit F (NADH-binding)/ferredoxin
MPQRPDASKATLRVRIDPSRCDGQGVCATIAPSVFALDRYGDAYVTSDAHALMDADPSLRDAVIEAEAMCPRTAILVQRLPLSEASPAQPRAEERPAPVPSGHVGGADVTRLLAASGRPESLEAWRSAGGFGDLDVDTICRNVASAGLHGQGGAAFPVAAKWRHLSGSDSPVVVANGAEREPGTLKDRHLMTYRPHLVLDGLRVTAAATGSRRVIIAVDQEHDEASRAIDAALVEEREAHLWDGMNVTVQAVPALYVAGEETALLTALEGGSPVPRLRPPYPAQAGLFSRPTVLHNVETLAQIALVAAFGDEWYRQVGIPDQPGTGLFTIGRFGGDFAVVERAIGYPLSQLLCETGLFEGARAAIVGGWSGGLLPREAFSTPLSSSALASKGASLGTKSIQVLGPDDCPVRVVAVILRFFAGETANQCPPCHRGLPDVAQAFEQLEATGGSPDDVRAAVEFTSTLFGRGICRLPDGAARMLASLLRHFPEEIEKHLAGGHG